MQGFIVISMSSPDCTLDSSVLCVTIAKTRQMYPPAPEALDDTGLVEPELGYAPHLTQ